MHWVYLSPHFDDAALSCGGLIRDQLHAGHSVEIWTICAGMPQPGEPFSPFAQSLHDRWQTGPEAVPARRQEDEAAGRALGVALRYWDLPDCIYRRLPDNTFLVNGEDDLWQPVNPQESGVIDAMKTWLICEMRLDTRLVSPMTLGGHVDHRLVRFAAEMVARERSVPIWYYADFPYVLEHPESLEGEIKPEWERDCLSISAEGLAAWQNAVAQYSSQISTFWNDLPGMRATLKSYWQEGGGACLWRSQTDS